MSASISSARPGLSAMTTKMAAVTVSKSVREPGSRGKGVLMAGGTQAKQAK